MHFNYRVIKRYSKEFKEDFYAIYETYYDDDGKVTSISERPTYPSGVDFKELKSDFEKYMSALGKPILNYEDIVKNEDEE